MAKKQASNDPRSPLRRLYDGQLRELMDQQTEEKRELVEAAFETPPASADEVDPWFEQHFHNSVVSQDVELYNRLHAMKAAIREAAGQGGRQAENHPV